MFSQIKENILNRIFILLPRSCPGMGLRGAGGVKNFSVGICDGAPSTARSSYPFKLKHYIWSPEEWAAIGMGCVIRESCYKGTILQRNYRKMTISWSFL